MKLHKKELFLAISCFFLAFLLAIVWNTNKDEALASRIAPKIVRFHILAESNRQADQALKLKVRTFFLDAIYQNLGSNASREDTLDYIESHISELEQITEGYITSLGFDYSATVEVCKDYFPSKTYGDFTFPRGEYDAVRVIIGAGRGRNWWCVLYPQLCFTTATYAVVPESSQQLLKQELDQQDYDALITRHTENVTFKREIHFKLWDDIKEAVNPNS